jgi:spermidine synthase
MKLDARFSLILLCFFLSGFAALLYETAWAREFAFVFGTSELAVVSVLAAYMAGLAAGAAVAARFVARVRRPVLVYGLLELGIAVSALAVPWGIRAALWLQTVSVGGQPAPPDEASVFGAFFYVVCSFAILMVPTGLMGATLPLLARHAVRRDDEIGRRVGALYAINTAGAVAGALATGFVLLPTFGLRLTIFAGAATNALVFCAASALARRAPAPAAAPAGAPSGLPRRHWVLPLAALSGAVSFTYEVIWMRLLGQLLGGSIQGFATMLASFLLGIAIGSAVAARLARNSARSGRGFALAQLGVAALSLAAFAAVDWLPEVANRIGAGRSGSHAANALIAISGLLPGALCIGATFPFAVRLLARAEADAAAAAARVYAWNTVGAISGALASGFFLLPALRFAATMGVAAGANLAIALAAACLVRPRLRALAGIAATGLVLLLVFPPATPWAVLRYRNVVATWEGPVVHYGVGRSATVMLFDEGSSWRLTANGLPEARLDRVRLVPDQHLLSRWLGLLPVLLRPETRSMLIVGLGGGLAVAAVPPTVEKIHAIELEREVVRAHERVAPLYDGSPLNDSRVALIVNDARGALQLTNARYDAIVSQPSHPWTAGASHLYTREFFALASEHLEPGGVFVQWMGLNFVDAALLRSLVATLLEVFPHVCMFHPVGGGVLMAASHEPIDPDTTPTRALNSAPAHFERFGLRATEDVIASWALAPDDARRFAAGAEINTDDRNGLATRSAGLGRNALGSERGTRLLSNYDPLRSLDAEHDPIYLVRRLVANDKMRRATRLAASLTPIAERSTALGWAKLERDPNAAAQHFRHALEREPTAVSARFGLLSVRRKAIEAGDPGTLALAARLEGTAAAVVAGWRLAASHDWAALRALEPILAAADPRDPSFPDALALRIQWRAASEDAGLRVEGSEIAAQLLGGNSRARHLVLGARAYATAGQHGEAIALLDLLSRSPHSRRASDRAALAVLDSLPADVAGYDVAGLRERLSGDSR